MGVVHVDCVASGTPYRHVFFSRHKASSDARELVFRYDTERVRPTRPKVCCGFCPLIMWPALAKDRVSLPAIGLGRPDESIASDSWTSKAVCAVRRTG